MEKELREILREAERQGWRVVRGSKHFKLYAPDGKTIVTAPTTPSDWRAIRDVIARMRRAGFRWPPKED